VIATVYEDVTTSGKVLTRGEIVVPGSKTVEAMPEVADYPYHFRKTFTPESGPIKRGETPEREFNRTMEVRKRNPNWVPKPLAFEPMVYRCEAVCGFTLNAQSPFPELAYEKALALHPSKQLLDDYADTLACISEVLEQAHEGGVAHGDLTLHNAMVYRNESKETCGILIDVASSIDLDKLPADERQAAIDGDWEEIYRDWALLQFHKGKINNKHAQASLRKVDELFPEKIADRIRAKLNPIRNDIE
jgi:hypothetical protein